MKGKYHLNNPMTRTIDTMVMGYFVGNQHSTSISCAGYFSHPNTADASS